MLKITVINYIWLQILDMDITSCPPYFMQHTLGKDRENFLSEDQLRFQSFGHVKACISAVTYSVTKLRKKNHMNFGHIFSPQ